MRGRKNDEQRLSVDTSLIVCACSRSMLLAFTGCGPHSRHVSQLSLSLPCSVDRAPVDESQIPGR